MCENCIYAIETDIDGLIDCQIDGRSKDVDMACDRFLPKFSSDELIRELKKAEEDSKNGHVLDDKLESITSQKQYIEQ